MRHYIEHTQRCLHQGYATTDKHLFIVFHFYNAVGLKREPPIDKTNELWSLVWWWCTNTNGPPAAAPQKTCVPPLVIILRSILARGDPQYLLDQPLCLLFICHIILGGHLFSSQSSLIGDIHLKPQVQHRGTLFFLEEMSETTKMDEVLEIFQKAIDHPSVGHHPPPPALALTKCKIYFNFSETHEQKHSVRDE